MTILPAVLPPLPREKRWDRNLRAAMAWRWLAAGWRDLRTDPLPSLAYGFLIFLLSVAIIGGLFAFGWDYILFPALAGFMVVGPILAVGLYEKSRMVAAGEPVSLIKMILVRPNSGAQILFTGVLLCLLMLLWMRAAVIVYALFFGLRPFPGRRRESTAGVPPRRREVSSTGAARTLPGRRRARRRARAVRVERRRRSRRARSRCAQRNAPGARAIAALARRSGSCWRPRSDASHHGGGKRGSRGRH